MDRRTKICVWIIVGGLVNFLLFTLIYIAIGGDARNGYVGKEVHSGQTYYLIRMRSEDSPKPVAWGWFLYSHIHGVSIWITHAAVLLAMLTLVKDHFVSVLNEGPGRLVIHAAATVVLLTITVTTIKVQMDFRYECKHPRPVTRVGDVFTEVAPRVAPAAVPASRPD